MENIIGERIKYFRQQRNLSRESLSNLLEISVHTLSKYEQGKREPTYEMLFRICSELDISIIDIFAPESYSETNDFSIYNKLRTTTSLEELLKLTFLQNQYFYTLLEKSTHTEKGKLSFFSTFSEYMISYLKTEELKNMPWIEDDLDG